MTERHHYKYVVLDSSKEELVFRNTYEQDENGDYLRDQNGYTKTITENVGSKIGVYGQVVDDFLSIDKNYIWTIATSALQEVDRQLQAEKTKVASLEARISALENN